MNDDDKWRDDSGNDHPQTIDAEPLEQTRSARLLEEQERERSAGAEASDESGSEEAILSKGDEDAIRRQTQGAHSMGDAIGGSAGYNPGSGTPGDKGDLGGGDPQKVG